MMRLTSGCVFALLLSQCLANDRANRRAAARQRTQSGSFERYVLKWQRDNGARYPGAYFGTADECNPSHNTTHGSYPERQDFYASYIATLAQSRAAQLDQLAGLEVGAMHNRAPVPRPCKMTYVDAARSTDLLKMHPELEGNPIVEPDIIDNVETLSKVSESSYDFVIASHLLEHAKNFLQALEALLRVTKSGGMVFVTLPNKCTTFDRMRLLTNVRHIVSEYEDPDQSDINNWEHFREWSISDAKGATIDYARVDAVASSFLKIGYHIHFHTFTADSLIQILAVARKLLKEAFDVSLVSASIHEMRVVMIKV